MRNLLLVVCTLCMISCSNELEIALPTEKNSLQTKALAEEISVKRISELVSSIEINTELMNEIKRGVDYSRKYGLDEEFRFVDMIKIKESKIFRLDEEPLLIQKMRLEYKRTHTDIACYNFFNSLANSDIQIYWPYSENWDLNQKPIIIYGGEKKDLAYFFNKDEYNNSIIDTISVTENFLKENTVWIISVNETPYEELPYFCNDEFVNKEGVFFISKYAVEKMREKQRSIGGNEGIYIDKIEALQKFEGGLAGGPEFQFVWFHVDNVGTSGLIGSVNTYRYNMSKSEVGQEIQLNYRIRPYWPENEVTNALVILEKDGGSDKIGTRSLIYNYLGVNQTVSVEFDYEKNDEFVFDQIFERSKIHGNDNYAASGDLKRYYNTDRDFWLTIAVKN